MPFPAGTSVKRSLSVPVYEYQCRTCGHIFERDHAIGEKKHYRCPECSSGKTRKIISNVGVIFKGTGFYATDNRKSNGGGKSTVSDESKTKTEKKTPASEN